MQQKTYRRALRGKAETARQELTSAWVTMRLCKPYRKQHLAGHTALLARLHGGTSLSAMAGLDRSSFNTEPGLRSISFPFLRGRSGPAHQTGGAAVFMPARRHGKNGYRPMENRVRAPAWDEPQAGHAAGVPRYVLAQAAPARAKIFSKNY